MSEEINTLPPDSSGAAARIISRFKGNNEPATVEMVANIWAEVVLLQDIFLHLAKNISPATPDNAKKDHFIKFATSIQKSLEHITYSLDQLYSSAKVDDDDGK